MQNLKDFTVGGVNFNAITIPKLYNQLTNRNNQTKGYALVRSHHCSSRETIDYGPGNDDVAEKD